MVTDVANGNRLIPLDATFPISKKPSYVPNAQYRSNNLGKLSKIYSIG